MQDFLDELPIRLCNKCGKCEAGRPLSVWDEMPQGCGYSGWLFQKKEEVKQKIRKQKELLLELESSLGEVSGSDLKSVQEKIAQIKSEINLYSKYGSENW